MPLGTTSPLRELLAHRKQLVILAATGIALALGVEFLASFLLDITPAGLATQLWIGLALAGGALFLIAHLIMRTREITRDYEALILFDPKAKCLHPISGYDFSVQLARTIGAITFESKALRTIWREQPLREDKPGKKHQDNKSTPGSSQPGNGDEHSDMHDVSYVSVVKVTSAEVQPLPKAAAILREAAEYLILEELSLHLSSYFQSQPANDQFVKEYTRRDIPEILLQNRVLALLSAPLEDRAPFVKLSLSEQPPPGEIHTIFGSNGSVYSRFHLSLPKGSTLSRSSDESLHLDSKRLSLTLQVDYGGFSANLPSEFLALYVGLPEDSVDVLLLHVRVAASLKRWALVRRGGWECYRWLDSFLDRLESCTSFHMFLKRICWDAIAAQVRVGNQIKRATRQAYDPATGNEQNETERVPNSQKSDNREQDVQNGSKPEAPNAQ